MFGPSAPQDQTLAAKLVPTGPDKYKTKDALKALAACESVLQQICASEAVSFIVNDEAALSTEVVVISDRYVTRVGKRSVKQRLAFAEIAETRLLSHPRGMLVVVESHRAQNEYLPTDARRYEHVIQLMTGTPAGANLVCAAIDRHLG